MMYRTVKKSILRGLTITALASVMVVLHAASAQAQWVTNGNNINNTNPGGVGIGTADPTQGGTVGSKLTVAAADDVATAFATSNGTLPRFALNNHSNGSWTMYDYVGNAWHAGITQVSGNVGIGTLNPTQIFHVHSLGTYSGTRITTAATGSTFNDGVNFGYDDAYGAYIWNREATPVIFSTNNTERARVDAAGNLGLGTTNPVFNIHVASALDPAAVAVDGYGNVGANFIGRRANGTASAPSAALANNNLLTLQGRGYGSTGFSTSSRAYIKMFAAENWTDTSQGTHITFATTANGTAATVERLRIDNTGNVGIGTAAPATALHVVGDVTVTGNISAKYQDVAEWVPSVQKLNAGTVVILDAGRNNHVAASSTSYDTRVAGVVSAQPGIMLGESGEGKVLVATTGRVKVKVDATGGPIRVGDLLVTSDREGYAMKSEPVMMGKRPFHSPGTIVGKALEPLAGGTTGEILVLLSLQ
ncbi:MAG TPA: hypothetical protein VNA19_11765 [Pyrinomonadaceae bacterium]|jgi:hypothetical protein|nr:hypothetical protein [Pyrinomonadaceae bacterium]